MTICMLYDICRPVARVKRSAPTGLNDPTFMSIFIRRSLEGVMIYTTSPPYSRTRVRLINKEIFIFLIFFLKIKRIFLVILTLNNSKSKCDCQK